MDAMVGCHIQAEFEGYDGVAPQPTPRPLPNDSGAEGDE